MENQNQKITYYMPTLMSNDRSKEQLISNLEPGEASDNTSNISTNKIF